MSKITKNELKRNDLMEWLKLTSYYFKNNIKIVIVTLSSAAFIVIAACSILMIKNRNNRLSAEILSNAVNTYHSVEKQDAESGRIRIIDSLALFKSILEKYPNSQSASMAYYYLGNLNYQIADYEQALFYLTNFINKFPHHVLINSAKINVALVYEMQNKYDNSAKIYEDLINSSEIGLKQKIDLKLNLARIYELQNNIEKAKNIYSELQNNKQAQFRLSCLSDK